MSEIISVRKLVAASGEVSYEVAFEGKFPSWSLLGWVWQFAREQTPGELVATSDTVQITAKASITQHWMDEEPYLCVRIVASDVHNDLIYDLEQWLKNPHNETPRPMLGTAIIES